MCVKKPLGASQCDLSFVCLLFCLRIHSLCQLSVSSLGSGRWLSCFSQRHKSFGILCVWINHIGTSDEDVRLESPAVSSCAIINSRLEVSRPVKTRAPFLHTTLYNHVLFPLLICCFSSSVSTLVTLNLAHRYIVIHNGGPSLPLFVPSNICLKNWERCCFSYKPKMLIFWKI